MQVELQCVEHADGNAFGRRSLGRDNRRNIDGGELVLHALAARDRVRAVERLPAAGGQPRRGQRHGKPQGEPAP